MSVIGQEEGIEHGTVKGYRQHTYRKVSATEECGCLPRCASTTRTGPARAPPGRRREEEADGGRAQQEWDGGELRGTAPGGGGGRPPTARCRTADATPPAWRPPSAAGSASRSTAPATRPATTAPARAPRSASRSPSCAWPTRSPPRGWRSPHERAPGRSGAAGTDSRMGPGRVPVRPVRRRPYGHHPGRVHEDHRRPPRRAPRAGPAQPDRAGRSRVDLRTVLAAPSSGPRSWPSSTYRPP